MGKYLAALSVSFETPDATGPAARKVKPSSKRKRLHLLYLLNDLYHHTKYNTAGSLRPSTLAADIQPFLGQLVSTAASFQDSPKHLRKITELLDIWEEEEYYTKDHITLLREAAKNAETRKSSVEGAQSSLQNEDNTAEAQKAITGNDAPFLMPAMHGDPVTPYYDLPAGNMIPHIIPNSSRPINPQLVKPLQLAAGPAEPSLVAAVQGFIKDVDRLYESHGVVREGNIVDIDELGQILVRDEVTGDLVGRETYYGWSKQFCDNMKERGRPDDTFDRRRRPGSYSRGRSVSPRKRKRYSQYDNSSESHGSPQSSTPSRSRSRYGRHEATRGKGRSRGSPGSNRSQDAFYRSRNQSHGRSRSQSYSPIDDLAVPQQRLYGGDAVPSWYSNDPPLARQPPLGPPMADPALLAHLISQGSQMLPGGIPIPPPPPLLHGGQWALPYPPPPPPPPSSSSTTSSLNPGLPNPHLPPYTGHPLAHLQPPPAPPPPASSAPWQPPQYQGRG